MKITEFKIGDLKPYERNNKIHSPENVKRIANSIEAFGWTQPIVIDEKNSILAGHGRYEAAKLLQLPYVPVFQISGLSDDQKRAYRLIDNKLAGDAPIDIKNFALELDYLDEIDFGMEAFGFDEFTPEGEDSEAADQKTGNEPISYKIVFDNEDQQAIWYSFVKYLKQSYSDDKSIAARLIKFLADTLPDVT